MKSISASQSHTTASPEAASAETASQVENLRGRKKYAVPGWVSAVSRWFQASAGFMISTLVHMLLILALAWFTNDPTIKEGPVGLLLIENPTPPDLQDIPVFTPIIEQVVGEILEPELTAVKPVVSALTILSPADSNDKESNTENSADTQTTENTNVSPTHPSRSAGGFDGRGKEAQAQLLRDRGGSQATQDAVERALAWIAAHQDREDGSWDFRHYKSPQGYTSGDPGTSRIKTGATGLALLTFLGKGYTHLNENPYQETVRKGLYYLQTEMIMNKFGGDLRQHPTENGIYGHGMAAIALCEAYAMTEDPELEIVAQQALRFIEHAQHNQGGWKYYIQQAGDLSVTSWQLMALKSGLLGNLKVSSQTVGLVDYFLDTVQTEGGSQYKYEAHKRDSQKMMTAIGLLCRMYLGWERHDQRLKKGAKYLGDVGPSKYDMYYNYYATNVLSHMGGSDWDKWNKKLSNYLVNTQSTKPFESGSWYFEEHPYAEKGGRLYITCLCTMILEVYYRHMPLYTDDSLDFKF